MNENILIPIMSNRRFQNIPDTQPTHDSDRWVMITKSTFFHSLLIDSGSVRCFSSSGNEFSHLDSKGNLRMVDVSEKRVTDRKATARSTVFLGHHVIQQIKAGSDHLKKGDVVTVSKVAGVQAAKKTSQLIPLCHQIPLSHVHLKIDLDEHSGHAVLECTARATSQTGVEMEALTGVTVASLTLYDMCKSLNRHIEIREVILISKTGGKSDLS